jgi:AraC-like DNA-binding protein
MQLAPPAIHVCSHGHRLMNRRIKPNDEIRLLNYQPRGGYMLDLEIFRMRDLRRRESPAELRRTHRYAFYQMICVVEGQCTQVVDFQPARCEPGSLLLVRPQQAHNFGSSDGWDGWMILLRPEFPLPSNGTGEMNVTVDIDALPIHLRLSRTELKTVSNALAQMRADAKLPGSRSDVNALLRYQLYALLTRLSVARKRQVAATPESASALQRFKRFKGLVEEKFPRWKDVASYARELGCTEKSLTRGALKAAGVSAKGFISSRVNLEAKRLLAHTDQPITTISINLGFDDPSNFIKFFKRDTRCTPAEFRRRILARETKSTAR